MTSNDHNLAAALREAAPRVSDVPSFDTTMATAEARLARRRRRRWSAGLAAAAAVAAIALMLPRPVDTPPPASPQMAELLETTSWQAPSDSLLPRRQIDIYEELPVLMESTKPVEGALL